MANVYLVHHGIKGQKWGIRRYQNEDGTLTAEGKRRYFNDDEYMQNYKSSTTRKYEGYGNKNKAAASAEFDRKISEYYSNNSNLATSQKLGKAVVKKVLMMPSRELTYNMARTAGYGRGRSLVKSILDINGGMIAGNLAGGAVNAALTTMSPALGAVGSSVGLTANYGVQRAITKQGGEYSLQQRNLRKKYIESHS